MVTLSNRVAYLTNNRARIGPMEATFTKKSTKKPKPKQLLQINEIQLPKHRENCMLFPQELQEETEIESL